MVSVSFLIDSRGMMSVVTVVVALTCSLIGDCGGSWVPEECDKERDESVGSLTGTKTSSECLG